MNYGICLSFLLFSSDVVIHALDHVWEIHKPYLRKSWFLSGLVRKAEMEGVNNIIDEEEEAETMTCKMYSDHVQCICYQNKIIYVMHLVVLHGRGM